jgi:DNA-directed RNA polymerase specialized sigma24 family protein
VIAVAGVRMFPSSLIVAAKIEGRTYRAIAEETDSTEDAVRMRVKRALTALARIYKNLDGEP